MKAITSKRRTTKAAARSGSAAELRVRVDFGAFGAIGPGKIRLLELIGEQGSITTAGRAMKMSYRRAWLLVESLNRSFSQPLVTAQRGGTTGGGAVLTDFGRDIVRRYRAIEANAADSAQAHLRALGKVLAKKPPATTAIPPKRRG